MNEAPFKAEDYLERSAATLFISGQLISVSEALPEIEPGYKSAEFSDACQWTVKVYAMSRDMPETFLHGRFVLHEGRMVTFHNECFVYPVTHWFSSPSFEAALALLTADRKGA